MSPATLDHSEKAAKKPKLDHPAEGGTESSSPNEKVAILDAGAQYAKVIDRRVRELAVECDLLPLLTPTEVLKQYAAVIISGGPGSVYDSDAPEYDPKLFEIGIPILGICYGMQLMNFAHGGKVEKKARREDGTFKISIDPSSEIFAGLGESTEVLLTHGDSISTLPEGFKQIATSGEIIVGIQCAEKQMYGVQFHPEVDLSVEGKTMLRKFLYGVCGLSGSYTMQSREQIAIDYIQKSVGDKKVLCLVSGGVDSSVCATLLNKAIGADRVISLHIDHGFMRLDESKKVVTALGAVGVHMDVLDGTAIFAQSTTEIDGKTTEVLCKTVAPEEKRKIIGDTFMTATQKMVEEKGLKADDVILAQGTLRPDLIESASKEVSSNATVIKTHHNDTQLVRQLRDMGRILEPLKDYHKDEVRALGKELGLPEHLVWRQPFPGPGLAIRILCAKDPYITSEFDALNQKLKAFCTTPNVHATLLPVRTVGVQGDGRSYAYMAGISMDGSPDWSLLQNLAKEIPGTMHAVNRVVYIFGKPEDGPLRTITPTVLSPPVINQLQVADNIVTEVLQKFDLMRKLSQVPVTLFPVDFGQPGARCIGIRAFITNDFMTGRPAIPDVDMPAAALDEMVARIAKEVPDIARVVVDLTPKPPATTEWE